MLPRILYTLEKSKAGPIVVYNVRAFFGHRIFRGRGKSRRALFATLNGTLLLPSNLCLAKTGVQVIPHS